MILSMSDLSAFRRCKRLFAYTRLLHLRELGDGNKAAADGSAFHAELEAYGRERRGDAVNHYESTDDMFDVAMEYIKRVGAKDYDDMEILAIEDPLYMAIEPANPGLLAHAFGDRPVPKVFVRTTFDLVYKRRSSGTVTIRDYKTFEKAPSADLSLDFQGRFYIATAMQYFQTPDVIMEYEQVRRTRPAPWSKWAEEDCYIRENLAISVDEAKYLWSEVQQTVFDVLLKYALDPTGASEAWYREDLKVGPHSCGSCFKRRICTADLTHAIDIRDDEGLSDFAVRDHHYRNEVPAWFAGKYDLLT